MIRSVISIVSSDDDDNNNMLYYKCWYTATVDNRSLLTSFFMLGFISSKHNAEGLVQALIHYSQAPALLWVSAIISPSRTDANSIISPAPNPTPPPKTLSLTYH